MWVLTENSWRRVCGEGSRDSGEPEDSVRAKDGILRGFERRIFLGLLREVREELWSWFWRKRSVEEEEVRVGRGWRRREDICASVSVPLNVSATGVLNPDT
jgi:hypothetical protein